MSKLKKALQEIADIVLRYHNESGNNPVANECRNIALHAIAVREGKIKNKKNDKTRVKN